MFLCYSDLNILLSLSRGFRSVMPRFNVHILCLPWFLSHTNYKFVKKKKNVFINIQYCRPSDVLLYAMLQNMASREKSAPHLGPSFNDGKCWNPIKDSGGTVRLESKKLDNAGRPPARKGGGLWHAVASTSHWTTQWNQVFPIQEGNFLQLCNTVRQDRGSALTYCQRRYWF